MKPSVQLAHGSRGIGVTSSEWYATPRLGDAMQQTWFSDPPMAARIGATIAAALLLSILAPPVNLHWLHWIRLFAHVLGHQA